jgi:hypothetical protein
MKMDLKIEIVMSQESAEGVIPNEEIKICPEYEDGSVEYSAVFYTRRTLSNGAVRLFGKIIPLEFIKFKSRYEQPGMSSEQ